MKCVAVLTPLAKQDLKNATDYYRKISSDLAKRFLSQVKEARIYISENPRAVDVMYKDIRMHLLKNFPYHFHYYIDEINNRLIILAIEFAKKEDLDISYRK